MTCYQQLAEPNPIPQRFKNDLPPGQYFYSRSGWQTQYRVTIEKVDGVKVVKFDTEINYFPVVLRDMPADATFCPVQVTYKGVYCEYSRYHDQTAIVVRELTPEEIGDTEEVGRMWRIRFADDVEINVFPEEIFPDGVMAQLEESDNSATEELMKIVEGAVK